MFSLGIKITFWCSVQRFDGKFSFSPVSLSDVDLGDENMMGKTFSCLVKMLWVYWDGKKVFDMISTDIDE